MSWQTDLILYKCSCDLGPHSLSRCGRCALAGQHRLTTKACLQLNAFRSYVFAAIERRRFIADSIRGCSSPKYNRSPELDAFAIWICLSGLEEPRKAHLYELANAISVDEPFSMSAQPPNDLRVCASKWKKKLLPYLPRYTGYCDQSPRSPHGFSEEIGFFYETILPDLKKPMVYPSGVSAPGCLDEKQFAILSSMIREFQSPITTHIVDTRNTNRKLAEVSFPNWRDLIASEAYLKEGKRYQTHHFIRFFLEKNARLQENGCAGQFVPNLKEDELRYLLRFDDLRYYTVTELLELGLIDPKMRAITFHPTGKVDIFKLLKRTCEI